MSFPFSLHKGQFLLQVQKHSPSGLGCQPEANSRRKLYENHPDLSLFHCKNSCVLHLCSPHVSHRSFVLDTGGSIIQVRWVALTCSCLPGLKHLLRLVAWEMKWANLRGDMGVFEKGLREEKSGRLKIMVVSQSCIILPYCAAADLVGT